MNVTRVPAAGTPSADEALEAKAKKAGAQFEAILLNLVLGDLERAFTQLPGATLGAVDQSYDSFAMETLSSALSRNGGIGLGGFIARALVRQTTHGGERL